VAELGEVWRPIAMVPPAAWNAFYSLFVPLAVLLLGVPRTIGIIQPLLLFLAIGASCAVTRYWLGGGYHALMRIGAQRRVLIYGAESAG
jgi:hypothetical protein